MPKKGTEYVCGECGTTLLVLEDGSGYMEELICCETPMTARPAKKRAAAKRAAPKKKAKKAVKRKR